jgi:hypothetical protein
MKDFVKWLYRIALVLLVIMLIDFNSFWLRSRTGNSQHMIILNIILAGLIIVLLISKKFIRRL